MTPDVAAPVPLQREPRWPAALAVLAVGGVYAALPSSLAVGPRWFLLIVVLLLMAPILITYYKGYIRASVMLGYVLNICLTIALIWSLALLIGALPAHKEPPKTLLRSAAALWVSNVLVFASWYWRLDAGGPHMRALRRGHETGAFLFPQMNLKDRGNWSPQFVDYLFLAFNTSTALSPTDTAVLSRWAKFMMMVQAGISLTVIAILAARAVNIL